MTDLITHLSNITDPRSALGKRHQLVEIIIIAICGIICGADDWVMIEDWQSQERMVRKFSIITPWNTLSRYLWTRIFADQSARI